MSKKSSSKANSSKQRARVRNARLVRAPRTAISRRNRNHLSLFRQMTQPRKIRTQEKRDISPTFSAFLNFLKTPLKVVSLNPICAARKLRRKVLFSLGLTKKGSAAKHHKMTRMSKVRCP